MYAFPGPMMPTQLCLETFTSWGKSGTSFAKSRAAVGKPERRAGIGVREKNNYRITKQDLCVLHQRRQTGNNQ